MALVPPLLLGSALSWLGRIRSLPLSNVDNVRAAQ